MPLNFNDANSMPFSKLASFFFNFQIVGGCRSGDRRRDDKGKNKNLKSISTYNTSSEYCMKFLNVKKKKKNKGERGDNRSTYHRFSLAL